MLGLDPAGYAADRAFLGATVGRYANRIAGGTFVLDGCRYVLPCNEPGVALHGGTDGFDRRRFTAEPVRTAPDGTRSVTLRRTSPDGENGFPGTLDVAVTYAVRGHELSIEHTATTDRPTVVNLTNHAYLNLAGPGRSVEDHRVRIPRPLPARRTDGSGPHRGSSSTARAERTSRSPRTCGGAHQRARGHASSPTSRACSSTRATPRRRDHRAS